VDAIEVEVSDDGTGISLEHQPRLFQPYYTTKKHGTGLGLFVTRKLLSDEGGSVEFRPRPGGGSVFTVRLPYRPPGGESPRLAAVGLDLRSV
jgi:two-component system sensor kinase FixL